MAKETILLVLLALLVIDFFFEEILDFLNHKSSKKGIPDELNDIYSAEEYDKSQAYQAAKYKFGLWSSLFSFMLSFGVVALGLLGDINAKVSVFENDIWNALMFFGVIFIASDILNLPFNLYNTFVIEEKFGFNKMSIGTFIGDKIKGYLLTAIVGGGILYGLLALIQALGQDFWVYFWVVISIIILLINMFYTSWVVPLFNKLKPLEDGELRTAIEDYSKKINFPLTNVFVIDGSKRSTKANAYFSGIGSKKKIVLFDTLIKNHSIEELVGVLAHEVGHFKKKHIIYNFILSIVQVGLTLFILSRFIFNAEMSQALGGETLSVQLNLIAFSMLFTPISKVSGLFMMIFSRKNEFEADEYAATTFGAKPLIDALKKLSAENLSNLTPHPWFVFFNYSHPPLYERLRALKKFL